MDADLDTRLDELIGTSSPLSAHRTPELDALLDELVASATPASSAAFKPGSRERRRRIGLVAASVVAIAGVGIGGAAASGILSPSPSTSSWFTEDGVVHLPIVLSPTKTCQVTFAPVPREASATSLDKWDQTLSAAHTFMKSVDAEELSVPAAVTAYRASVPTEQLEGQSAATVSITAVGAELAGRMQAALTAQGLPADAISVATFSKCGSNDSE
ncbi:hypothetical protein P5P86_06710 [Nocardioides sp. BP30]|uniref:hypothetical protein n=1 Tax=Nocardioides sp. BP30 TaxID=3036374 RepID=UPI0024688ABE|nr:hypothetical protein [Nocardioides sp. BP30]WGL53518.1 hypothetical protein P5P86_06710 [Nocardioides sp. BP30]